MRVVTNKTPDPFSDPFSDLARMGGTVSAQKTGKLESWVGAAGGALVQWRSTGRRRSRAELKWEIL